MIFVVVDYPCLCLDMGMEGSCLMVILWTQFMFSWEQTSELVVRGAFSLSQGTRPLIAILKSENLIVEEF